MAERMVYEGKQAALAARACMDLTSLGEEDTPEVISALCQRAGESVAAVCVWPRFVAQARREARPEVRVAAVVNFPSGSLPLTQTLHEIGFARDAGADEIDMVFPYERFLSGNQTGARVYVEACKSACAGATLKVIMESGLMPSIASLERACDLALEGGADFLKTSTGKVAQGATPEAARAMMGRILARGSKAGFKVSGGVRTVKEAALYLNLANELLGAQADPTRFRIGASGLLSAIESELGGSNASGAQSSGY